MRHPAGASHSQSGARRVAAARMSPAALLVMLIRGYQRVLSPLLGPRCRFVPSCSEYAAEALQRHGALRGLWLTCWRLLRCQPFCRGGYDPVPSTCGRRAARRTAAPSEAERALAVPMGFVPSGTTPTEAAPAGAAVPTEAPAGVVGTGAVESAVGAAAVAPAAVAPAAAPPAVAPRDWPAGPLASLVREGRGVRHNGAHADRADVATSERGEGPDGASGPPGRGDSTC